MSKTIFLEEMGILLDGKSAKISVFCNEIKERKTFFGKKKYKEAVFEFSDNHGVAGRVSSTSDDINEEFESLKEKWLKIATAINEFRNRKEEPFVGLQAYNGGIVATSSKE